MQKLLTKFLILYSVIITALFLKLLSKENTVITLAGETPSPKVITKEIFKKQIIFKESKLEDKTNQNLKSGLDVSGESPEDEDVFATPGLLDQEKEQAQQEANHDNNSEKMLAFFEQAVGINLTPEQEQKALSALRAYDEADPTAIADADTAFLDRKLNLTSEQKTKVRQAITEFNHEPEQVSDEIADKEIQQIESQNQAYFDQVSPFLDEKQRTDLIEMMNQGTVFVDE